MSNDILSTQNRKSYIYCIMFYDGTFYYGVRLCPKNTTPWSDKYVGSPSTHRDKWKEVPYIKFIINIFDSYEDAQESEKELIRLNLNNPRCLNENVGGVMSIESRRKGGRKGGKISGKKHIESGHLSKIRIKSIEKLAKEFILKSPQDEIIKGKSINNFCKINNLNQGAISDVINKKRKSHKGWRLP